MRIAAVIVFFALTVCPAAASASVEDLFHAFDLFGSWAADCKLPAALANPHVSITVAGPGLVFEEDDLGSDFARNRYSVLSAARTSATRLLVVVIFQPGGQDEERQKLSFLIRNGTRRTMFNQPDGGPARVKNGIELAHGVKIPLMRKCD